ncbi:uncharacterized protein LOC120260162 [Dioscorea cayenensis subsp. rotundata]|uniref:Uncharacterized protein LOC120260162 n=1 Tax=Dioscorea cayennensis subsp. rotundata TaxID=55577 RepID=A0AB40B981_DIOCR|nr:uncharacterized protein LOC120260162 [Dioscorea cayenensis subsp. rotundata]
MVLLLDFGVFDDFIAWVIEPSSSHLFPTSSPISSPFSRARLVQVGTRPLRRPIRSGRGSLPFRPAPHLHQVNSRVTGVPIPHRRRDPSQISNIGLKQGMEGQLHVLSLLDNIGIKRIMS